MTDFIYEIDIKEEKIIEKEYETGNLSNKQIIPELNLRVFHPSERYFQEED
jgi:hypothetical protein